MPLLSIVIPTRDREEYAASCMASLLRIPSPDLEIIVQDNSESTELVGRIPVDPRLRYEHRGGRLSVIDNCTLGVARATGAYVTLLGDDDGVNPEIMEATRWAQRNELDALVPSLGALYHWPDVRHKYYGRRWAATLTINRFSGAMVEQDVEAAVRTSAKFAFQNLVDAVNLPKLYYGIIRRSCLEQLFQSTGAYFHGVSPDMSAAMALSAFVRRVWSVDYPLFVPGTSARSTAGANAQKQHIGRLEDQPHLPVNSVRHWPIMVPAFFAVQTVWAQSAIAALEATGRDPLAHDFDLARLHAMCAVFNPQYVRTTVRSYYRALRATKQSALAGSYKLLLRIADTWLLRARILLRRVLHSRSQEPACEIANVSNIHDAVEALSGYLRDSGRRFADTRGARPTDDYAPRV